MKAILLVLFLYLAITNTLAGDCLAGYTHMEVRHINNQIRPSSVSTYFTEFASGTLYCAQDNILLQSVSSHTQCGTPTQVSGQSFLFKFEFGFTFGSPGSIQFRFGIDFGLGGVVLVDGVVVKSTFNDQWWAGDWTNSANLLLNTGPLTLGAGCHIVQVYGKEACCDGDQTLQLNAGNGWVSIDPTVLGDLYVPPIVQQSPPCIGESFWTSVNAAVPKHWCYCNCWIPGASWNQTASPPYTLAQLAPACVLDPANKQFYTTCVWNCPADTSYNSYGVIPINTWLNDCVYH